MSEAHAAPSASPRPTPPWLFLPSLIPFGATAGHVAVALPYLLRQDGVPMERIAALSALTFLPHSWKFLWTPLLDTWLRRKHWHLCASLVASVGTLLAFLLPPQRHFALLSVLLLIVNFAAATSHNALGSLCATTVAPARKGLASGFFSAGQLAATGLLGGLMLLLVEPPRLLRGLMAPVPLPWVGVLVASLMAVTSLLPLVIDEPAPPPQVLLPLLRGAVGDALRALRSRVGWTGLLICLSPVGTAAAANVFAALGPDYHAGAFEVMLATGLCAGLANALGALIGGWLADRINRRLAYLLGGALCAVFAIVLALAPPRPLFYVIGTLGYAVASGVSYATFYAFVFEMIGPSVGATTTYGVFAGTANLAIAYVTYLDGLMYAHGGRVGLLGCDAALGILGVAVVGAVLGLSRRREGPGAVHP